MGQNLDGFRPMDRSKVPEYLQWVFDGGDVMAVLDNYVCEECQRHGAYRIFNATRDVVRCVQCLSTAIADLGDQPAVA